MKSTALHAPTTMFDRFEHSNRPAQFARLLSGDWEDWAGRGEQRTVTLPMVYPTGPLVLLLNQRVEDGLVSGDGAAILSMPIVQTDGTRARVVYVTHAEVLAKIRDRIDLWVPAK